MSAITEKRLEKAKELAKMFEDFEKSGLGSIEFCKKAGIQTSRFYYWRSRYRKEGIKGLVDHREGTAYKITEQVKEFIRNVKMADRLKSSYDISKLVEKRFNMKVRPRHIRAVLEGLGLNDPVGRKPGKPIKKTMDY